MKLDPLPYQIEDVQRAERFGGRILNCLEPGLGKTYETLWALKRNPDWLPALVVAPANAKFSWQYESQEHWGMPASVCEGRTPPKGHALDFSGHFPITIINYDILKDWIPHLKKLGFKTLVCDECQEIQNSATKRTRAVQRVAEWVEHVFMLSATPLNNRPSELFPALNILWPDQFPAFSVYAQEFCRPRRTPWGMKYDGAENLDVLNALLRAHGMVRRRWADVVTEMPPKERKIIRCELLDPQEYNHANYDFMSWLQQNAGHRVQAAKRAEALTKLGALLQITARLKLKTPVMWANKFLSETNEKLVLFCVHQKAVDVLQRRVEFKSVTMDGTMTDRQKFAAVQQFRDDPNTRLFIGSRSAWKAINLQCASNSGILEFYWRPSDFIQLEGRTYRIGQKAVSRYNYFVAAGTIEERICEVLQEKQQTISSVLDGGSQLDDLNMYEMLLDELETTRL